MKHTDDLVGRIGSLLLDDGLSDVELVVEGEALSAHKIILASSCEFFRYAGHSLSRGCRPASGRKGCLDQRYPLFRFWSVMLVICAHVGLITKSIIFDVRVRITGRLDAAWISRFWPEGHGCDDAKGSPSASMYHHSCSVSFPIANNEEDDSLVN